MGDPWRIGSLEGVGKPNVIKIIKKKKKKKKKRSKNVKNRRNRKKKSDFFYRKWSKMH